ncbi:MAG: hypothetical protein ABI556_02765 [Gemmatimonadales bacterium]
MRNSLRITTIALLTVATTAGAQQRPAIRQLGAVVAKSAETFASVGGIRALSNGSLLVNDIPGRRVVMFDPTLGKFTVIADSTSATANAYGGRVGWLVAYRGDSSLFIDPTSVSMLVIDPSGKVARVMAIPRAEDANALGSPIGNTAFDASGRLVYRALPRFIFNGGPRRTDGGAPVFAPPAIPDSALILRVDLASRKVDTVGYIRTPKIKMEMKQDDKGNMSMTSTVNPLPVIDDWAVLADGTIAIVRGSDYHVDWVKTDGSKVASTKIPFDWQRMTDEDKIAFIDSVKAARERLLASTPAPAAGAAQGAPGGGGAGGGPQIQIFGGPGGPGGGGPGAARPGGGAPQFNFIPASELPDYKPPFLANSTRPDSDGNLWIRTIPTSAVAGGPVYDVINKKGELVERVQIPVGRSIVGFGAGGAVYLLNRDGATATIEKASVR